jgi:hypothetical protein
VPCAVGRRHPCAPSRKCRALLAADHATDLLRERGKGRRNEELLRTWGDVGRPYHSITDFLFFLVLAQLPLIR